ncbi:MAG: sigma-70 family RNA polymerase sigma factor [Chloroflexi bacterium]|jgi:RNA polymerase sigma-70 factor, ECF subfamily|nr:sigma-70 family RNA polymerase sigma factor [Chloroflexota bacterium]
MSDWKNDQRVQLDAQLVKRAKHGDSDAFGELHDYYVDAIYNFLASRTSDPLDAEDLTGEVFLRAWRSLKNYRQKGYPFSAYLFRIARNLLIDHYRQSQRQDEDTVEAEDIGSLRGAEKSPDAIIVIKQEHQQLKQYLDNIREDYRDVLVLRFLSGLSPDETAKVMQRSSGAVRVLQHRALAALRKQLGSSNGRD